MAKKKTDNLISPTALGRELGVSHTAVQRAIKEGRIPPELITYDKRGFAKITDKDAAIQAWTESSTSGKVKDSQQGKVVKGRTTSSLAEARLRSETFKGKKAELEYMQLAGELVEAKQVERAAYEAGKLLRDGILNIPARISGDLSGVTDAFEIEQILLREFTEALKEMEKSLGEVMGKC